MEDKIRTPTADLSRAPAGVVWRTWAYLLYGCAGSLFDALGDDSEVVRVVHGRVRVMEEINLDIRVQA